MWSRTSQARPSPCQRWPASQTGPTRTTLLDTASSLRGGLRSLRSLLVEIHPPDLNAATLPAALDDLCAPVSASGVAVELQVGDLADVGVQDAALVWRVAQEAVRNTLRHARATTMSVDLRADGRALVLTVEDDGIGFEPGSVDATAHYGLRGLESLVRDHGGVLDHPLGPGRGDDDTAGDAGMTIRVLLVDDHAVLRSGLERLLAGEPDIEVVGTAADGAEALEDVRDVPPDVVLMDLQMPGSTG